MNIHNYRKFLEKQTERTVKAVKTPEQLLAITHSGKLSVGSLYLKLEHLMSKERTSDTQTEITVVVTNPYNGIETRMTRWVETN